MCCLAACTFVACKASKQSTNQKNKNTASVGDSLSAADTSQSELSKQFDSVKSKVSGFLNSLLPPKTDTTKGQTILTPPKPSQPVLVGNEPVSSGGFIKNPVKPQTEFDSNGNVIQRNVFLGGEVGVSVPSTFDAYIHQREESATEQAFRDAIAKSNGNDTSKKNEPGLLADYSQISIPIPPSIVPSIFGKPSINLRVSGDVAVHIAYRDNQFLATQGALFSGSETGLDFKQEINISTNGTIGDKLKVGADWGSERSFQFENLLKLGYTGFPDEILQSIEAGNVSLTTPSQYIGTQQALFGVKAVSRFGPLYVTALVAQKKGDRQSKSFGGGTGSTSLEHIIQPANYKRTNFFLDTIYISKYEPFYSSYQGRSDLFENDTNTLTSDKSIEVWRSVPNTGGNVANLRQGIAYYNLEPISTGSSYSATIRNGNNVTGEIAKSYFVKVDTSQYTVNPYTGVLSLSQEPNDQDVIAVYYLKKNGKQVGEASQAGDPNQPLVLKMIKPRDVFKTPSMPAWRNILKNSYYVGGAGFDDKDFNGRIIYTAPDGRQFENVRSHDGQLKVVSALGLDRFQNSNPGIQQPDGIIDAQSPLILDKRTGTITFPFLEPFGKHVLDYYRIEHARNAKVQTDSTFYFPQIYTDIPDNVRRISKNNQISMNIKFSGGVSSTLQLNAFNIVDGSVKVSIGGRQLVENQDYRVDYNSGTVSILKPDLISTGQINVDYETHDIFTNATKNVLGLRTELPILDKGLLGFSIMNYSMHLPSLKTRQGEEPLSNWIMGFDANYNINTPFVTDFLNYIPLLNLKEKSNLSVKADVALSLPNPNTQTSPIPADNGASIAYLDDFEGDRIEFPLYMTYGRWMPASQPFDDDYKFSFADAERPSKVNELKAKTYWYEHLPQDVLIRDIKPFKSVARLSDPAQVLDVVYDPNSWGIYNPNPNTGSDPKERWGGLMQYYPGLNVSATNSDAIEFWMKIDDGDPNGVMKFDLGRISEDVIPDKILETEDKNGNAKYDPGEDVGLDGKDDAAERDSLSGAFNPDDPNNDNYSFTDNSQDYSHLNGSQGNQNDRSSNLHPDTEDLDGNGALDLDDDYYEYEIPLNTTNKYIIGQGTSGWYQYRIPLVDFKRLVGLQDSSFSNISYYRLWFKGFDRPVHVRLHEITIVGSQWTRGSVGLNTTNPSADNSLRLGYVNIEDNAQAPTNYTEPPGAQRDRLAGETAVVYGNEQSLDMKISQLASGDRREAFRVFQSPNDIFNYRAMATFVHGDSTLPALSADTTHRVWVYMRFGIDNFNYYEYRRPLAKGWQNIHIDFGQLTSLKAGRPSGSTFIRQAANDGVPGSSIAVVGSPSLTNAPQFTVGVENERGDYFTSDVWWDELRLLDANDHADYAMNASTQLKLAEFGRITASIVDERPDFHRVDERFNQGRALNFNWNVTGEFSLQKFLPKSMEGQSQIPLTLAHTETIIRPKYLPNTDVEIDGALSKVDEELSRGEITPAEASNLKETLRLSNETVSIKNSLGASGVKLYVPGSFFLLPAFVNRLIYGVAYAEEFTRSPQYEYDRTWAWTGSIGYELPPLPNWSFSPLTWSKDVFYINRYNDYKINFLPQRVAFAISATRGRVHSLNRISTLEWPTYTISEQDSLDILRSRVPLINRTFTTTRGMQVSWKFTDGGLLSPAIEYGLDVTSNLVPLETIEIPNAPGNGYDSVYSYQRPFNDILKDIFLKNGQLARLGQDFNSSQRVAFNTTPRMPYFFGLEKLVRPVFNYRVDYRWQNDQTGLQNAKQGAWSNTITTGLELNVRDLGAMIFGKPAADDAVSRAQRAERGTRRGRDDTPSVEELPQDRGIDARVSPAPKPRQEPRNQVDRGEEFRPQSKGNPLGNQTQLLDTLNGGRGQQVTGIDTETYRHTNGVGTGGLKDRDYSSDTTLTPLAPTDMASAEQQPEEPSVTVKDIVQAVLQKPFFDWNGTRFNFIQTNTSSNGALQGDGPGITNFLARGIFAPEFDANGPSRAYQLGLITDPHGRLLIHFKPVFPFIGFEVRHGDRASTTSSLHVPITDVFTQQNNFDLATSRPLWEGASINLNWKVQFSYDERNTMTLDSNGRIAFDPVLNQFENSITKAGEVSRTFFSIPPIPFLGSLFKTGIQQVGEKYAEKVGAAGQTVQTARTNLSAVDHNRIEVESFMEGFETLPFFSSFLREYLPRLNYAFSWSGLEKFPLFRFADHASFRHGYTGNYRRAFRMDAGETDKLTTLQTIVYGFRPLIALDLSWDKFYDGKMTASLNYDTQTEWGADYASQKITKRLSTTIGVTANYQRQGLVIPFLKLNLKNEFGASFTFSKTISADSYYEFWTIGELPDGIGNGGITKTSIEPRVSYSVSQQLTLEGFYRYEKTTPSATGVLSPPTRLVMAGVDIRLKIQ